MLRQLMTLAKGRTQDVAEAVLDANALSLLRQQLREAASGVEQSRKALAIVMAYSEREKAALERIMAKLSSLEVRALDALAQGHEDLAQDAADAMAELEAEAEATRNAIAVYEQDIGALRQTQKDNEALLMELKRGQRLAEANNKTLSLRGAVPDMAHANLDDAAATLRRLKEKQAHAAATSKAMAALSARANADAVDDKLAA